MPSHCHTHCITHFHVHLAIIKELNARNSRIAPIFSQHFMLVVFFDIQLNNTFPFNYWIILVFWGLSNATTTPPHNSIDFPYLAFYFSTLK